MAVIVAGIISGDDLPIVDVVSFDLDGQTGSSQATNAEHEVVRI